MNLGSLGHQGRLVEYGVSIPTIEEHISYELKKPAFFLIYNIGLTRKYLCQQATETLVHAYIIKTGIL